MRIERVFGKGGESVVGLIGEDVAVGQEEDAWTARWLAAEVPAAIEKLPRDLKRDEGFAGAGGKGQQDAIFSGGDSFEDAVDGDVLIIAALVEAAFVFEGNSGKSIAPGIGFGERDVPEFLGCGVTIDDAFLAGGHVHAIQSVAIGRVGEPNSELICVIFRLGQRLRLGIRPKPSLRLRQAWYCDSRVRSRQ